jgi:ribokinase
VEAERPGGHDVVVVGSANLDVVLQVTAIPAPGETVLARGRAQGPGGKGANQAAAAALAGARTALVTALGADAAAQVLLDGLTRAGVDLTAVRTVEAPTGTAFITVDAHGENAIVVDLGANARLTDLTPAERNAVRGARVLLCQLEVPLATVADALAAAAGLAVLNAAPAQPLPPEVLRAVDVLVVNEHEARALTGAGDVDAALARLLRDLPEVVVTLGAAGAVVAVRDHAPVRLPGVPARAVVDTTGAGDVFCGALAAARATGAPPVAAAELACAAASLSVERPGAGRSAPTLAEARARLQDARRG